MEFVRRKKRGQNQKVRRTWFSQEGYRIVWRKAVYGVRVPARFQACVRTIIPNYGGVESESFEMWDFTDPARRLFKTRGTAGESCERHYRLWSKACEATGVRQLDEIFGRLPNGYPAWVRKKLHRRVYELLTRPRTANRQDEDETCSSPPDQPEACDSTPTRSAGPPIATGPTSPAAEKAGTTTLQTGHVRSKATDTSDNSRADAANLRATFDQLQAIHEADSFEQMEIANLIEEVSVTACRFGAGHLIDPPHQTMQPREALVVVGRLLAWSEENLGAECAANG